MPIIKERIKSLVDEHKVSLRDTGSSSVQIALLTERIKILSEHLKKAPKDFSSRQGLLRMVGTRRQLLSYLKRVDGDRYQKIIQKLELRK